MEDGNILVSLYVIIIVKRTRGKEMGSRIRKGFRPVAKI